ncbi:MAG: hypothetical protein IJI06_08795 [Oscillospiraceae bacterium]|nr:hypothetical protein [Oscillospiraceae bacterium]
MAWDSKYDKFQGKQIFSRHGDNPWHNLAASVVARAIADTKLVKKGQKDFGEIVVSEEELTSFFHSKYCGVLLGCTDYTGPELAERIGL